MCTGFTKDMCSIYMNTICAVSLTNYLRAVADALRPLRTHQRNVYTAHIVFIYIMKKQQKFSFSKIILNFFFFMLIWILQYNRRLSFKNFFSKCDPICTSHKLKKSLGENSFLVQDLTSFFQNICLFFWRELR